MSIPHIQTIGFLTLSYLVCALPFGVIVSKWVAGRDVRKHGSGNIGATNVARLMGKKWGILVLVLDALKGFIVVKISFSFGDMAISNLVGVIAVFAHCYPIYLKFRGGKGVATALGVIAALSPLVLMTCTAVFLLVFLVTRIISTGSLAASLALPLMSIITTENISMPVSCSLALLVWWKHRENINRLLRGQEPKFF